MPALSLDEKIALLPGLDGRRVANECGWLCGEMVETDAARDRLRRWLEAGAPPGDPAALVGFGDLSILKQARLVLSWLPPPCVWYVVSNIAVVGVGRDSGGWCDPLPALIGARLIALPGTATDEVIAHEYSHGWLHGNDGKARSVYRITLREKAERAPDVFAAEVGGLDERLAEIRARGAEQKQRYERDADALARTWLNYHRRNHRETHNDED